MKLLHRFFELFLNQLFTILVVMTFCGVDADFSTATADCSDFLDNTGIDNTHTITNTDELINYLSSVNGEFRGNNNQPGVIASKTLMIPVAFQAGSDDADTRFVETAHLAASTAIFVQRRMPGYRDDIYYIDGVYRNELEYTIAREFPNLSAHDRWLLKVYFTLLKVRETAAAVNLIFTNVDNARRRFYVQLSAYRDCEVDARKDELVETIMSMVAERLSFDLDSLTTRFTNFTATDFDLLSTILQRFDTSALPSSDLYSNFSDTVKNQIFRPMNLTDWQEAISFIRGYLTSFANRPAVDRRFVISSEMRWQMLQRQSAGGIQFYLDFTDDPNTDDTDEKTADEALVEFISRFTGRGIDYTSTTASTPVLYSVPLARYLDLGSEHSILQAAYIRGYIEHRAAFETYSQKITGYLTELDTYLETLKPRTPPAHLSPNIWQYWISEFQSDIRDTLSRLAPYYVDQTICSTANASVTVTTYDRAQTMIAWMTQTKKIGAREKRTLWESIPGMANDAAAQRWRMRSYSNQNNENYEDGEWLGTIAWEGAPSNLQLMISDSQEIRRIRRDCTIDIEYDVIDTDAVKTIRKESDRGKIIAFWAPDQPNDKTLIIWSADESRVSEIRYPNGATLRPESATESYTTWQHAPDGSRTVLDAKVEIKPSGIYFIKRSTMLNLDFCEFEQFAMCLRPLQNDRIVNLDGFTRQDVPNMYRVMRYEFGMTNEAVQSFFSLNALWPLRNAAEPTPANIVLPANPGRLQPMEIESREHFRWRLARAVFDSRRGSVNTVDGRKNFYFYHDVDWRIAKLKRERNDFTRQTMILWPIGSDERNADSAAWSTYTGSLAGIINTDNSTIGDGWAPPGVAFMDPDNPTCFEWASHSNKVTKNLIVEKPVSGERTTSNLNIDQINYDTQWNRWSDSVRLGSIPTGRSFVSWFDRLRNNKIDMYKLLYNWILDRIGATSIGNDGMMAAGDMLTRIRDQQANDSHFFFLNLLSLTDPSVNNLFAFAGFDTRWGPNGRWQEEIRRRGARIKNMIEYRYSLLRGNNWSALEQLEFADGTQGASRIGTLMDDFERSLTGYANFLRISDTPLGSPTLGAAVLGILDPLNAMTTPFTTGTPIDGAMATMLIAATVAAPEVAVPILTAAGTPHAAGNVIAGYRQLNAATTEPERLAAIRTLSSGLTEIALFYGPHAVQIGGRLRARLGAPSLSETELLGVLGMRNRPHMNDLEFQFSQLRDLVNRMPEGLAKDMEMAAYNNRLDAFQRLRSLNPTHYTWTPPAGSQFTLSNSRRLTGLRLEFEVPRPGQISSTLELQAGPFVTLHRDQEAVALLRSSTHEPVIPRSESAAVRISLHNELEMELVIMDNQLPAHINRMLQDGTRFEVIQAEIQRFATDLLNTRISRWSHSQNGRHLSLFLNFRGEAGFRSHEIYILRDLAGDVAYFSPGHGTPGGTVHTLNIVERGEANRIVLDVPVEVLINRYASLPGVRSARVVFYNSCGSGVAGSGVANASQLARAANVDVIAPLGDLAHNTSLSPSNGSRFHDYVVLDSSNNPLAADQAFGLFQPNGSWRRLSFEEFRSMIARDPVIRSQIRYRPDMPIASSLGRVRTPVAPAAEAQAAVQTQRAHFLRSAEVEDAIFMAGRRLGAATTTGDELLFTTIPDEVLASVIQDNLRSGRALGREGDNANAIWLREAQPFYGEGITLVFRRADLEALVGTGNLQRTGGLAGQSGVWTIPHDALPQGVPYAQAVGVVESVGFGRVIVLQRRAGYTGSLGVELPLAEFSRSLPTTVEIPGWLGGN